MISTRRKTARAGVSIVEVLVSIVVLAVGVMGLASTNALLMRMIGGGGRASRGSFVAQQKIEAMHSLALSGSGCGTLATGADTVGIYQRAWTVTSSGTIHRVQLLVTYKVSARETRTDTLGTTIVC